MSKNDALVSEYIERMSGDILEDRYRPQLAELIRGHSGIYALFKGDDLYYVGLAVDLMRRVNQHLKDRHRGAWNRFSVYLTGRDEHLKPLESLLLRVYRPVGNKQGGRLPGANDRKRALEQAMKRRDTELRDIALGKPARMMQQQRSRKGATRDEALAALRKPLALRAVYKGEVYRATLMPNDTVKLGSKRYSSLSAAAVGIVKRPMNGWWFWQCRKGQDDWVRLTELGS